MPPAAGWLRPDSPATAPRPAIVSASAHYSLGAHSRAGSHGTLPRLPQYVTDPAQSVQQSLLTGIDLSPQIRHIGLDDVDVTTEVITPHVVQNFRLAQHRAGVDDEVTQQGEFRRRQ